MPSGGRWRIQRSVGSLAVYAPHAAARLLIITRSTYQMIITRSTYQIQHEQTAEESTSTLDATSCGWRP
jgi:hypothetical protein